MYAPRRLSVLLLCSSVLGCVNADGPEMTFARATGELAGLVTCGCELQTTDGTPTAALLECWVRENYVTLGVPLAGDPNERHVGAGGVVFSRELGCSFFQAGHTSIASFGDTPIPHPDRPESPERYYPVVIDELVIPAQSACSASCTGVCYETTPSRLVDARLWCVHDGALP